MRTIKVKTTNHTFELRNLEVYERMSEETTAFCADVYIDGICVGQCQNNGKGEGNYPYIGNEFRNLYEEVESEVCANHFHEEDGSGRILDWNYNMDFLIGMMVECSWYDKCKTYTF